MRRQVLAVCLGLAAGAAAAADDERIRRGEYIFHAALCAGCHTVKDGGAYLAGGRALQNRFGTFYSTNITPDPSYGIGGWSEEEFLRAMTQGRAPDGRHYYPVFPYSAYTRMSRDDLLALKVYLDTVPPVAQANRPHQLPWYLRWRPLLAVWKWLNFTPGEFRPDPARPADWNRGAYLAQAMTHCAECHTPRNRLGGLRRDLAYAGAAEGPDGEVAPNITPDREMGIGRWNRRTLAYYLQIGMTPGGDFAGGQMGEVIDVGTSRLTPEDLDAIATYVLALPPVSHKPGSR